MSNVSSIMAKASYFIVMIIIPALYKTIFYCAIGLFVNRVSSSQGVSGFGTDVVLLDIFIYSFYIFLLKLMSMFFQYI